ncbi:MAG TPA: preprotein translocase subunit SecG [Terrimicrobiaceae bacterium]
MWLILPILLGLHVVVCLLLVLVVLMQLPRSEGLGAAFGSAVTENIFGAQTTHVLAKFTVWLGVAFFAITLMLAVAYSHRATGRTRVQQELMNTAVPTASPAPVGAPTVEAAPSPLSSPEAATSAVSPDSAAGPPSAASNPSPPPASKASPAVKTP